MFTSKEEGLLFVLSGPSGVGKDATINRMKELGFPLHFIVTYTTRSIRANEVDGRDYHFVSASRFQEMIQSGEFLEWALVYGDYKGNSRREVREAIAAGKDVILRIDVQGAQTIRQLAPEAVFIFLAPSSMEELFQRLRKRKSDSPEQLATRMAIAPKEMAELPKFDYVVVNRDEELDQAVRQIEAIITAERCRVKKRRILL
ncbi:MAG: guanylate kinase [Chloroflexi bacterium]|nr:guanylate kinase [Chloroflexota bacterium]